MPTQQKKKRKNRSERTRKEATFMLDSLIQEMASHGYIFIYILQDFSLSIGEQRPWTKCQIQLDTFMRRDSTPRHKPTPTSNLLFNFSRISSFLSNTPQNKNFLSSCLVLSSNTLDLLLFDHFLKILLIS